MTRQVQVRAPCRLHFGLFGFGRSSGPQWGGVGLMVEPPTVNVTIEPAATFTVGGSLAERAEQFAAAATGEWELSGSPACHIHVESPLEHIGLGVGTQLGLAVAAGLRRFLELPTLTAEALTASVGRGGRSAVGTHGFLHGGLIVDAGKESGQALGILSERVPVPNDWRVVLIAPGEQRGLSGDIEADAFARLPPVPGEITQELWRLTEEEMLPAAKRDDCAAFGEAVYQFGRFAGECFAAVQGGPFASETVGRLVDAIRDHGVDGVGQSSWGPTVFAIVPSDAAAESLAKWLQAEMRVSRDDIRIALPNNSGAVIS
jgi:beta-ribofuranosylaminobenzene 5'-phosphate synthase